MDYELNLGSWIFWNVRNSIIFQAWTTLFKFAVTITAVCKERSALSQMASESCKKWQPFVSFSRIRIKYLKNNSLPFTKTSWDYTTNGLQIKIKSILEKISSTWVSTACNSVLLFSTTAYSNCCGNQTCHIQNRHRAGEKFKLRSNPTKF